MSKSERLQVLIEPTQSRRLQQVANQRGVPVAAVVRAAIDHEIDREGRKRRRAGDMILAATTIDVPLEAADLAREIDGEYSPA